MQETRKKRKNELKKSLLDVLNKKKKEEDFLQDLEDVYSDTALQEDSKQWLEKIENLTEHEYFENRIIETEEDSKFYYAHSTYMRTKFHYFVNRQGLVLFVHRTDNITNEYIYNYQNKDCYFLPIDNQGCIKSVDFDVNNKNILKLGNLRIYDLIKESHLYEKEEKVEKLNYFQEINNSPLYRNSAIVPHHLVYIKKDNIKNDGRDNRIDNIIWLPDTLHKKFNHNIQSD